MQLLLGGDHNSYSLQSLASNDMKKIPLSEVVSWSGNHRFQGKSVAGEMETFTGALQVFAKTLISEVFMEKKRKKIYTDMNAIHM